MSNTTTDLSRLGLTHDTLVSLAEQGYTSAVLTTLASVLSRIPELDKPSFNPHYWEDVISNLHEAADTCQQNEFSEEYSFEDSDEESEMWERLVEPDCGEED